MTILEHIVRAYRRNPLRLHTIGILEMLDGTFELLLGVWLGAARLPRSWHRIASARAAGGAAPHPAPEVVPHPLRGMQTRRGRGHVLIHRQRVEGRNHRLWHALPAARPPAP